jgi:hypothetical protein
MTCGQISSGHSMSWSSAVSRFIGITPAFPSRVCDTRSRGQGRSTYRARAGVLLSFPFRLEERRVQGEEGSCLSRPLTFGV